MDLTITFCRQTVKTLNQHLQAAFRTANLPLIQRSSALLMLADQHPVPAVADRLGVGRSTVYAWLNAFLLDRFAIVVQEMFRTGCSNQARDAVSSTMTAHHFSHCEGGIPWTRR